METSKSPLRQIPGCSMLFGFLILLAHGALGQKTSIEPTREPTTFVASTRVGPISDTSSKVTFRPTEFPTKKLKTTGTGSDATSEAHPVSKLPVATSSNKATTPVGTLSLEQLSTPKHLKPHTSNKETTPVSTLSLEQLSTPKHSEPATLKQTKQADTTADNHTSANQETATTVATTPGETETTKVVGKSRTTVGESTSFSTTAAPAGSIGLKPRSTKREKEKSTTPGQHVQGGPTAHDTSSRGPEAQHTTGTSTIKASGDDTGVKDGPSKDFGGVTVTPNVETTHSDPKPTASPAMGRKGVIVAIVLSILLLMVLLIAILLCWRRHHSGSTSFKTAGWAGQVALPDDSGLDKEVEQGAPTAGEGEGRRATLTTFFGRRQSRVPSVAMEEVVQKETGDVEEAQPLIDGDVSKVSSLEGSGEPNGKLPEPTVQQSQEKEFPPPPANQEESPPTQVE
ncbi:PREDICTED: leukosialin [Gekko japonicus]|uniref:Leukosialin n=1 Tax=Gekko japonicus TaxID=146911 RepID=A0ABM1KNG7_GEKJA|nr:PREDICTED: leukosialin [Gekko japonicus]